VKCHQNKKLIITLTPVGVRAIRDFSKPTNGVRQARMVFATRSLARVREVEQGGSQATVYYEWSYEPTKLGKQLLGSTHVFCFRDGWSIVSAAECTSHTVTSIDALNHDEQQGWHVTAKRRGWSPR